MKLRLLFVVMGAFLLLSGLLVPLAWQGKALASTVKLSPELAIELARPAVFTVTTPAITHSGISIYYPTFAFTAIAEGFAASQDVEVLFGGTRVARGLADASGVFTGTGTTPIVVSGTYTLTARAVTNPGILGTVQVTVAPTVTISPHAGGPGTPFALRALGFASGETLTPTLEDADDCAGDDSLGIVADATASGTGAWNGTIPIVEAGTYSVSILGETSGCIIAAN